MKPLHLHPIPLRLRKKLRRLHLRHLNSNNSMHHRRNNNMHRHPSNNTRRRRNNSTRLRRRATVMEEDRQCNQMS